MFRTAGRTIPENLSRATSRTSARTFSSHARRSTSTKYVVSSVGAAATATLLAWYYTHQVIHNDAPNPPGPVSLPQTEAPGTSSSAGDGQLNTLVWGSNKTHVLDGEAPPDSIRAPTAAPWLTGVALRDLGIHERHAACVDARGDVYQWGDGFFGDDAKSGTSRPALTLRGKNITRLQVTPTRVFALSASGHVYVLAASATQQVLAPGTPTPSSTPWWGTGWLWGEEESVDFAQLIPREKLSWGEKFVDLAAGTDHLLALTSSGRTFAHPISLSANSYGQLGIRKIDVPAQSSSHPHFLHPDERVAIELTPKAIVDPYSRTSPAVRQQNADNTKPVQDKSESDSKPLPQSDASIRFCDTLFEVPALRGIHVARIAAGARSSYAMTDSGRVLGWGANEFGQIGLGNNVTLDTITVPTEIMLWRSTSADVKTKCRDISVGGNLTLFTVERSEGPATRSVDVLACGNGQWGGLGNAQYTNAQNTPVRSKNVSGLLEYDEKTKNMQPIVPQSISVSPTGHVLAALGTGAQRDLLGWGANYEYQLGNGRRGSVAVPTVLEVAGGRMMLDQRRAKEVRDLSGKVWKRGVDVEQCAVAGWGNSVVYWKIS